jgi:glycosyltransferase involved in cell wall biosynthesis
MNEARIPTPAEAKIPLSVLILTRNEEKNIGDCLRSVTWAAEIFVVDSRSTDQTAEIARSLGAKVYSHAFEGYAKQRNWALDNLPFSFEWVLVLDADERIPAPLAREISLSISNLQNCAGFYLKPRLFFLGRWLKHGGLYPSWILRLFKRGAGRFDERLMNERILLSGASADLENCFDHKDQRPLSDWIGKHNRYADLEAEEYLQQVSGSGYQDAIPACFWGSQPERKRWIKLHVWNHLPLLLRPFLLFFRNYILLGGFLDGRQGFVYHVLWSFWYPFLISAKVIERQHSRWEFAPQQGTSHPDRTELPTPENIQTLSRP